MNIETLRDLLVYELRQMYYVETELVDALEDLADDVQIDSLDDTSDTVREAAHDAFAEHRDQTAEQVERLERAFEGLEVQPASTEVPEVDALVRGKEQFDNILLNDEMRPFYYLDAGMKVEQLEIVGYESMLRLAETLDVSEEVTGPIRTNLEEERDALERLREAAGGSEADSLLTRLAEKEPLE